MGPPDTSPCDGPADEPRCGADTRALLYGKQEVHREVTAAEPAREVAEVLHRSDSLGTVDAGQLTSGGMCSCLFWHM